MIPTSIFRVSLTLVVLLCVTCEAQMPGIIVNYNDSVQGTLAKGRNGNFDNPDRTLVPFVKAAYLVAEKLQEQPVSWLGTEEGKSMLKDAVPPEWPPLGLSEDKKLAHFSFDAKLLFPLVLALTKDAKMGAKQWLNLPLPVRLGLCRYIGLDRNPFAVLAGALDFDAVLTEAVFDRLVASGCDPSERLRLIGASHLAEGAVLHDGEGFVRIMMEKVKANPDDRNLLLVVIPLSRDYPRHGYLVINGLVGTISRAALILDEAAKVPELKQGLKGSLQMVLPRLRNNDLVQGR